MTISSGTSRLGVLAMLAAFALLAACGSDLPTSGAAEDFSLAPDAELSLALSFDELSTNAAIQGDVAAASDFADGALAIRLGVRPTEIAVTVDGRDHRYHAVVTGIVERENGGPELLKRTLLAWTGERPTAVLRITSRSDEAAFARDEFPIDIGKAIGHWNDLRNGARFLAIDGVANTSLNSVAGRCPVAESDPRFDCRLARYDLRTEGSYELVGDATLRHQITSTAGSIAGVVIKRIDGGRGGRPEVTTSRPHTNE